MIFHKMFHSNETYGFSLFENDNYFYINFSNTLLDDSLIDIFSYKLKYLI